jgi:hypothetical protein
MKKDIKDFLEIIKKNKGKTNIKSICNAVECLITELRDFIDNNKEYKSCIKDYDNDISIKKRLKYEYFTDQYNFLQDEDKTDLLLNNLYN